MRGAAVRKSLGRKRRSGTGVKSLYVRSLAGLTLEAERKREGWNGLQNAIQSIILRWKGMKQTFAVLQGPANYA